MSRSKQVSVVKTAQMANTLKLVVDGRVAATISVRNSETVELHDTNERLIGTYGDAAAALAAFERAISTVETSLDY